MIITFAVCLTGYVWLYYATTKHYRNNPVKVCLIKYLTNLPCPSCGSTRAVISLSNGDFIAALEYNPMGYLIALIMLVLPFWIFFDMITTKFTLISFYDKLNEHLKNRGVALFLILVVLMNWIWNIWKGL
ncbi:DUF2752 domain-containing protein [Rurimicrobium arvi]|uniref:DUF2752 domain-containing protein n=1 Tax=Rurimicrobium arvi TaxID=2049916 RepID=UPI0031DD1522